MTSKISIMPLDKIMDPSHVEQVKLENEVTWESGEKDCTHISYQNLNNTWFLVVGYVGSFEVYSEDGKKRYIQHNFINDEAKDQEKLNSQAIMSSCKAWTNKNEYLMLGSSHGNIY